MLSSQVYAVINGERDYQESAWRTKCHHAGVPFIDDAEKGLADWLVYIKGYYNDAVTAASHAADYKEALRIVRKLAALCVACMEQLGGWDQRLDGTFGTFYPGPLPRKTIYYMIERVRAYHMEKCGDHIETYHGSINGYLLVFGCLLEEAIDSHLEASTKMVLRPVLAMAGIAVHCMEDYGAPPREAC